MGTIARQTAKNSTVLLVATAIGALSAILVYPLDETLYGNVQFILSSAMLLIPIADLGVGALVVRFFPTFSTKDGKNHGFLGIIYACILVGLSVLGIIGFLFQEIAIDVFEFLDWEVQRFKDNLPEIAVALVAYMFITRSAAYLTNYKRIVWPSVFDNLMLKVLLPVIVLLTYWGVVSHYQAKWGLVFAKLLAAALIVGYVWRLGLLKLNVDFSFLKKDLVKSMASYASYGFLGSISSAIAFQIDTVMIAGFKGYSDTGIYSIAAIIASVILIPSKGVNPLVGAEISSLSASGEMRSIGSLYRKSSLTLLVGGAFIMLGIWWNIYDLFDLTAKPDALKSAAFVVLFLGLAKLIDMLTGVNGYIIAYSKHFRWNLVFVILMAILTISSNLYFIPRMGIVGAALATLISLSLFNFLKFLFVWYVFKMQPFTWSTVKVLILGGLCSLVLWLLPLDFHPIINIAIRSILVVVLFGLPTYYFRLSEDISLAVEKYWMMGLKLLKLG